jgi:hypothetical protein
LLVAVRVTIFTPLAVVVALKPTFVWVALHGTLLSWAVRVKGTSVATKKVAWRAHAAATHTITVQAAALQMGVGWTIRMCCNHPFPSMKKILADAVHMYTGWACSSPLAHPAPAYTRHQWELLLLLL